MFMKKIDTVIDENNQNIEILAQPLNRPYIVQKEKTGEILANTDSLVDRQNTIENSEIFRKNNLSNENQVLTQKVYLKK